MRDDMISTGFAVFGCWMHSTMFHALVCGCVHDWGNIKWCLHKIQFINTTSFEYNSVVMDEDVMLYLEKRNTSTSVKAWSLRLEQSSLKAGDPISISLNTLKNKISFSSISSMGMTYRISCLINDTIYPRTSEHLAIAPSVAPNVHKILGWFYSTSIGGYALYSSPIPSHALRIWKRRFNESSSNQTLLRGVRACAVLRT